MVHARALLSSASRLRTNRRRGNLFADQRLVAGSGSEKDGICLVAAIAPTVASILVGSSLAGEDVSKCSSCSATTLLQPEMRYSHA